MTEQERVLAVATMLDCWLWIHDDQVRLEEWKGTRSYTISSSYVAELCGLPIEVVNAAVDNLQDDGKAEHRDA